MKLMRQVTVDEVLQAFRKDQNVQRLGRQWPSERPDQITLLRDAHRPVDLVLSLNWGLYELDRDEFLSEVRPVWCPHEPPDYCWTLNKMLSSIAAGNFFLPEPNNVRAIEDDMRQHGFRDADFVLVGYRDIAQGIRLEDGHNRVTAAALAESVPDTIKMYLGQ